MINRDFVITSLQRWDIPIGSNIKDIALEIAKDNRVVFINTPSNKTTKSRIEEVVTGRLWVFEPAVKMLPIGKLPDGVIFDFVNRINQKRIFSGAKKAIKQLGFSEYTLIIDNDGYNSFYANEYLSPDFSIYYRLDNVCGSYWDKHLPRVEPLLASKCDCVMSNNQLLADSMIGRNDYLFDVGQGVDLESYQPEHAAIPDDMADIPKPIVGYTGTIVSERLDADLIYNIGKRLPSISFVFVGPEDNYFKSHKLHTLDNLYFLGAKPTHTMPNYIASFNVCINPQKVNKLTIGNYPRKIDEYLAMGKPTVATKTDAMEMFRGYVECCEDQDQWVANLKQLAYAPESKEHNQQRIEYAHTHSWSNSVNKIYQYIKQVKNSVKR